MSRLGWWTDWPFERVFSISGGEVNWDRDENKLTKPVTETWHKAWKVWVRQMKNKMTSVGEMLTFTICGTKKKSWAATKFIITEKKTFRGANFKPPDVCRNENWETGQRGTPKDVLSCCWVAFPSKFVSLTGHQKTSPLRADSVNEFFWGKRTQVSSPQSEQEARLKWSDNQMWAGAVWSF